MVICEQKILKRVLMVVDLYLSYRIGRMDRYLIILHRKTKHNTRKGPTTPVPRQSTGIETQHIET